MARSKHTVPRSIRAARRVCHPYEPRGLGDPSTHRTAMCALKRQGVVLPASPTPIDAPIPLPRLRAQKPRPGHHHPAGTADIARVLRALGPTCTYGLRSIALVQAPDPYPAGTLRFGTLRIPGQILLYDQPASPWVLRGTLPASDVERLRRAGANVEPLAGGTHTLVSWPGTTLRDFMLFDVLLHEIGHHVLQHERRKRVVAAARARDHEAHADRFARASRRACDMLSRS